MFTIDAKSENRFAIMGCAYGNVPALNACLADARSRDCEKFLFLGDAIGCCGHSDEILNRVRESFDNVIAGNLEQQAVQDAVDCGCGWDDQNDQEKSNRAFRYALESLGEVNRVWISSWPEMAYLETAAGRVLLCHGSPRRINEFLFRSTLDEKPWKKWLSEHGAIGLFCAHTGFPWVYRAQDGSFLANCGAAGKPDHDGDPAVHYLTATVQNRNRLNLNLQRVSYDHRSWTRALAEEGMEELYRKPLRTGFWTYGLSRVPEEEKSRREDTRS